jgi:hypothetical protein
MAWNVLYIIGKLLERRCLKWARIAHLDILNTSYGQKKGQESNCQFDSRPEKVENRPDLLVCRQCATYRWLSTRATTLLQTAPRFEFCSQSYGAPKSQESQLARFRNSHAGVPRKKNHLDVGPMERCRVYYKGEGGGFPQVRAMVNLVCLCCMWLVLAPKVLQLCTNHLVWVVCRLVWVSEACQLFLVPSRSSNTPLYPSKCCELGSVPRLLLLPLFCTWIHFWILQGVGSASLPMISYLVQCNSF